METLKICKRCGKQFVAFSVRAQFCDPCKVINNKEYHRDHKRKIKARKNLGIIIPEIEEEIEIPRQKTWWERYESSDNLGKMSMLMPEFRNIHNFINSYGDLQTYAFFHGADFNREKSKIERLKKYEHEQILKSIKK